VSFRVLAVALAAALLIACRIERPDPASQAAAILHKHPSDFLDQLASLDALAAREADALETAAGTARAVRRPGLLAESLYAYSKRLRPALAALSADSGKPGYDSARIAVLNAFVFDTLGIVPVTDSATLGESVPSLVIERRRGACVGLVLLYLALGRSLDMPLVPVFLPGHIFVRLENPAAGPRSIETLRGGIARSDSFYRETFSLAKRPWYRMGSAKPEQALAALVFNLGNVHLASGNRTAAKEEFRLVEEALPGFPEALGSQGACAMLDGDSGLARDRFRAALAGDSLSGPAQRNLASLDAALPKP
jgi:regulator of sirC expression with transglutaminase-like and TPR domain